MSKPNFVTKQPEPYDPRWFIWTLVFLLVTGISLTSYILLSSNNTDAEPIIAAHSQAKTK